ncbi:MAG TPA: acyl-CoA dehydrogenase [Bacillota bacterium]
MTVTFTNEQIKWIRSEMSNIEQTKTIRENVLHFIIEKQLFKLIVPEELGGKMLSLPEAIRIFQDASYVDGNFGWLVTVGSGGGMFTPNFTKEAAKTFLTPKDAVIAGSGFPAGTAKVVDGGYIVNGEWFYCSGSQYASMFTATCQVTDNQDEQRELLSFIFTPEQVKVINDWDAFGLKGTSSHTIRVTEQFVPNERSFSIFTTQNNLRNPLYHFPFLAFSEASFTAIVLGIGKHFLEEVHAIAEAKKTTWTEGEMDRYAFILQRLEKEEKRWKIAEKAFHNALSSAWEQHVNGNPLSKEQQTNFGSICKKSVTTILTCANHLFRYIGMQSLMEQSMLNRIWRDLHTAAQHTFLTPYKEEETEPYRI